MIRTFCNLLLLVTVFLSCKAPAGLPSTDQTSQIESVTPLYQNPATVFMALSRKEPLRLTLEVDMREIYRQKNKDPEYIGATISYKNAQLEEVKKEVKVRVRGKTRRDICAFPPLRLKFNKKELHSEGLDSSYNELKIVTHCKGGKYGDENALKEYLIYKMYNLLTDSSYRVQLLQVRYVDRTGKRETVEHYGFLIENTNEMAARLNGEECETCVISNLALLDQSHYKDLSVFQFMIGNTDWKISANHNVKIIKPAQAGRSYLAVPYDFDYAGFVDSGYGVPHENLGIKTVRERFFLGHPRPFSEYTATIRTFQRLKPDFYDLCQNFTLLSEKERYSLTDYLDSFYDIIETPRLARISFFCTD